MTNRYKIINKNLKILLYMSFFELKRIILGIRHTAEIDITDNCNLRCKHCYHFQNKKHLKKEEFPLEEWKKRFNKLYNKGIRHILLVGGEPTLRLDVLMLAYKFFPIISVITNGIIKIPKNFDHILFVSIDGDKETNDKIRGKDTFAKVIKNYQNDERVILNMTLTKDNYKKLQKVVEIANDNNFRGVVCNIYIHSAEKNKYSQQIISKKSREKIINELKRVKKLYPKSLLLNNQMIKWYEFPDHTKSCYWREQVLHYDVFFKKRKCFIDADCSDCGCFAGARGSFFSRFKDLS